MKSHSIFFVLAALFLRLATPLHAQALDRGVPPEKLPPVTVRWEDPGQTETFVVEGARYQCRVSTLPARILSLQVDGKDLIGPKGIDLAVYDHAGVRYAPAPAGFVPHWNVWRRRWSPAYSARARMNVWSAGPYYWQAHLLDIPLVSDAAAAANAAAAQPVVNWDFHQGALNWKALHDTTVTPDPSGTLAIQVNGVDPYIESPAVDVDGPVTVVVRLRTEEAGSAAWYWMTDSETGYSPKNLVQFPVIGDGAWHDYRIPLPVTGHLRALRFDPPGMSSAELQSVRILKQAGGAAQSPPLRGHLVLHATADQLRIELKVDSGAASSVAAAPGASPPGVIPPGDPSESGIPIATAVALQLDSPVGTNTIPVSGRPLLTLSALPAAPSPAAAPAALAVRAATPAAPALVVSAEVLGPAGSAYDTGTWRAPLDAAGAAAVWVLRVKPEHPGAPDTPAALFADDLSPLPASAFTVTGGSVLGFDPASGTYQVRADVDTAALGFDESFLNPNRECVVRLRAENAGAAARRLLVQCQTGIGNLEAAVLADPYGFPLPVPVQVCKNFDGELEEPDDTSFGDAYFPLTLGAHQTRSVQAIGLCQNWGTHPLKQVSSIRFGNIYWHLSTGVSETTCFTQNGLDIGRSGTIAIPDFRPLSGPMLANQPQHECEEWPGFLQYNHGAAKLVYERTTFTSVSPDLVRFTNTYHTSDDAAIASVAVMETPQRDEMRTFVHLHYDWVKETKIDGDARESFRWLNLFEKRTPEALLWSDTGGVTRSVPITASDTPLLLGEPLAAQSPFVASHAADLPVTANAAEAIGKQYQSLVLVRSFRAQLGGKEYTQAAFSARFGAVDGAYWLTVPDRSVTLEPGDYIDADIMLMPYSGPTPAAFKPERERLQRFGAGVPGISAVTAGKKIADFPATVQAEDEVAAFTLHGGFDEMPLIVTGYKKAGVPLLWRSGIFQDQQVNGGDGYQVEADDGGGYRFVLLYPIRDAQRLPLMVTRADCTTGISHVRQVNGDLVLEAPRPGTFTLKAPVLFAPGRNVVSAGAPAIAFTGMAAAVRAVPIRIDVPVGQAEVTLEPGTPPDGAFDLHVSGAPATLTFQRLVRGATYVLTIDGNTAHRVAADGTVSVTTPVGASHVTLAKATQ